MTFNKKTMKWQCEDCEYHFSEKYFLDDCVFWFCDECETYLNNQDGFNKKASKHICRNCGYENDITFNNIKGTCSDCGKTLPDPDAILCADCRQARREKTKRWLIKAGKIVSIATIVGGVAYLISKSSEDEKTYNVPLMDDSENYDEEYTIKCANCGNTNDTALWDEGDTIYCSACQHRTLKETGEDNVVECPYCHRMRDRKAYYCRYCGDSMWKPSTKKEFAEIDKSLKNMGY